MGGGCISILIRDGVSTIFREEYIANLLQAKIKKVFPSCILCGTTKYLVFILLGSSVAVLKDGLNIGWWSLISYDLWFIPTILVLYVISPFLYRMLIRWPTIVLTIISISMFINGLTLIPTVLPGSTSPLGVFSHTIERLPVFTVGMFISIKKNRIDNILLYSFPFLFIAVGIKLLTKGMQLHDTYTYSFLALAFGVPALIIINISILRITPLIIKTIIDYFGEYSLELYLVHEFIFGIIKIKFTDVSSYLILPTAILLSCLVAYLCRCFIKSLFHEHKIQ